MKSVHLSDLFDKKMDDTFLPESGTNKYKLGYFVELTYDRRIRFGRVSVLLSI